MVKVHAYRGVRNACFGAVAAACVAASADGGLIPELEFSVIEQTTGYNQTFNPAGSAGDLFYSYGINVATANFAINGGVNGSPTIGDPTPALLSSSLSFENLTNQTLEFIVTMTLPMSTGSTPAQWTTSASWVLGGTNAQLGTLPGMPLWAAFIDGVQVASLYDDEFSMGPGNVNEGPIAGVFGPIQESISIQLAFSLSANAVGGPTGGFSIIPAPGALAFLAVGFTIGGTRRRR